MSTPSEPTGLDETVKTTDDAFVLDGADVGIHNRHDRRPAIRYFCADGARRLHARICDAGTDVYAGGCRCAQHARSHCDRH